MTRDFATRIKEARKKCKLTQQQLAEKLNITQQTVHNWERGAIPSGIRLAEINRVLGINFAVEQAEKQEPVAWMVYTLDGTAAWVTLNPADFTSEHRALPLYTTPPQRQPLTEEELRRLHSVNAQLLEVLEEMLVMWEDDPSYGSDTADKGYAAIKAAKGGA